MNTPNPATAAYDDIDLDQFEDFESDDLAPILRNSTDYLDGMWGRAGLGTRDERAAVLAHGMVQSFINAFARDGHYRVTFDPNVSTAGTDLNARKVVLTPAPVLDTSITAEEAGRVLTGLAVHEISHPRYGRSTADAVNRAFPGNWVADRLSNILDDVRIEARFADDYPGYAGVFAPTLEYVGRGMVARNGGAPIVIPAGDAVNLASGAIRYPSFCDWTGLEAERDWWQAWGAKWSREDAPRKHVEAIREALRHIVATKQSQKAEQPEQQPDEAQPADEQDAQPQQDAPSVEASEGESNEDEQAAGDEADEDATDEDMDAGEDAESAASDGDADDDEEIDAEAAGTDSAASHADEADDDSDELSDEELNDLTQQQSERAGQELPRCVGTDAVNRAAADQGVDQLDIEDAKEKAQEAVEAARDGEDDGHGGTVDVARSLKGLIHGRINGRASTWMKPSDAASRHIRDAILRSRSGHTGVSRYQKRGALDNRGLHRIASRDSRLFSKKHAPDPGKYLIWVMVDVSSSMAGDAVRQAAQVAEAIAAASRSTPNTRVQVWAWSNAFRPNRGGAGVARVWQDGQPTTDVFKLCDLPMGGTPDVPVLTWAARAINREARGGEQPVIFFASDGEGNYGNGATKEAVAEVRKLGVDIRSISLGDWVTEEDQIDMYGQSNYVAWQGSILATANPLARMIARITGKAQR